MPVPSRLIARRRRVHATRRAADEAVHPSAPAVATSVTTASWRDYHNIDENLLADLRERVAEGDYKSVPINGVIPAWLDKRVSTFVERTKQHTGRRRDVSKQAVLIEALLLFFATVPMPPRVDEDD